jgi:hypothetical protein
MYVSQVARHHDFSRRLALARREPVFGHRRMASSGSDVKPETASLSSVSSLATGNSLVHSGVVDPTFAALLLPSELLIGSYENMVLVLPSNDTWRADSLVPTTAIVAALTGAEGASADLPSPTPEAAQLATGTMFLTNYRIVFKVVFSPKNQFLNHRVERHVNIFSFVSFFAGQNGHWRVCVPRPTAVCNKLS